MDIIETRGLTKQYGDVVAIKDLSLQVKKGEIFSLLGPNGAGKTTIIKALLGLIVPTSGQTFIMGHNVQEEGKLARKYVGYLPEVVSFYDNLTALQTLSFYAELQGGNVQENQGLLREVGLGDHATRKVGGYSKGMTQRLGIAQAMIGKPPVLILDEPTSGLDPRGAWEIRKKIRELNREGITIFLSSHILSEVQEVSHRVGILHHGTLMALDTVEKLSKKLDLQPKLQIELQEVKSNIVSHIKKIKGVRDAKIRDNLLEVQCDPRVKAQIITALEEIEVGITNFTTVEPSLEEVFLKYTEE